MVSQNEHSPDSENKRKPGIWQIVVSVLAAALGVNSRKNQEKDFQAPTPTPFIVGGIIFGVIFVVGVAFVVALVLRTAG